MSDRRILYLHGLRGGDKNTSYRISVLKEAYGPSNVSAPNLQTRPVLLVATILFTILVGSFLAAAILALWYWTLAGGISVTIGLTVLGAVLYMLCGRAITYYLVHNAARCAEKEFYKFKPNVIVATSFGSIVALRMKVPRVALVLLAPALDAYTRYMRSKQYSSVADYPYTLIIHGNNDDFISLDDSIRLLETSDLGQCKLEVIDDDHSLATLSAGDFKEFVDEAYKRGRNTILHMTSENLARPLIIGDRTAHSKIIEPQLFGISNQEIEETATLDRINHPPPTASRNDDFRDLSAYTKPVTDE